MSKVISDPHELTDLAPLQNFDQEVQKILREGECRLRDICDPELINERCFADQRKRIEALGGVDACKNATVFNHTPTPREQALNSLNTRV